MKEKLEIDENGYVKKIYQNKGDNMTVRELINEIVDTCESFDQEIDLRAECCDDYEPATHRERLDISNIDGKLELYMEFDADFF